MKLTRITINGIFSGKDFFEESLRFMLKRGSDITIEVTSALSRKDRRFLRPWYISGLWNRLLFLSHTFRVTENSEIPIFQTLRNYFIPCWTLSENKERIFYCDFDSQRFFIEIKDSLTEWENWLNSLCSNHIIREFSIEDSVGSKILVS